MPLTSLLDAWVADGLIGSDQAARIRARGDACSVVPPTVTGHPRAFALVVEALGYLGGVIILVASMLIASLYWSQIGSTGRLAIVGSAVVALLAAGFAVPARLGHPGSRLRSVLWLLSTGASAGFLALLGAAPLELATSEVFVLVGVGVAAYATGLWLIARTLVQQVAMMGGLMLCAAALANDVGTSDALPGFAVWGVALTWLLLGWRGRLEPTRIVMVFGAAAMFGGALTTIPTYAGIALALVTALAVVTTAVLLRDLPLLVVGAIGTLLVLPSAVVELFPGDLAAPIAMLVVGAVLVGVGLLMARRGEGRQSAPEAPARSTTIPS